MGSTGAHQERYSKPVRTRLDRHHSHMDQCSDCLYSSHLGSDFNISHGHRHKHQDLFYNNRNQRNNLRTKVVSCSSRTMLYFVVCTVTLTLLTSAVQAQTQVTLGPLKEGQPSDTFVGNIASVTGISQELTGAEFQTLKFIILDSTQLFRIGMQTGALYTNQMIDREEICGDRPECIIEFDVTVRSGVISFFRMVEVKVNITDDNDNRPRFPREEIIVDIPENNEVGLTKLLPSAVDPDIGKNSVQKYTLLQPSNKFSLHVERRLDNRFLVSLVVKEALNREERELYKLLIAAEDGGDQPFTGTLTVHVNVTDKNDNNPEFTQQRYSYSVEETAGTGQVVGKLTATDKDAGRNADVRYSMAFSNRNERGRDLFAIDEFTGEITIISPLQYDAGKTFEAVVEARDRGDPPRIAEAPMTVTIVNVGNNAPLLDVKLQKTKFSQTVSISEDAHNSTFVGKLTAIDNDPGPSGEVRCRSLHPSFKVENFGDYYAIFKNGSLDREQKDNIDVTLVCTDSGTPPMTASIVFNVVVLDVNDNAPKFNQTIYTVDVVEENIVGKQIFKISAVDPDDYNNNVFTYSLFPEENRVFSIDENTGIIKARTTFDHEVEKRLNVIVLATDSLNPSLVSTATVVVNILDINDNYPEIITKVLRVPEEGDRMKRVGRIRATDKDSGMNSELIFSVPPGEDLQISRRFRVDTDGTVVALQVLDREVKASYDLRVEVRDRGQPSKMKTGTVTIIVEDINDNEPVFVYPNQRDQSITIPWATEPNRELVRLNATDDDAGENKTISYLIYSGNNANLFALDPASGSLFLRRYIYPDDPQLYKLMVTARDGGVQPQESATFLDVEVDVRNATATWLASDFERETKDDLRRARQARYVLIAGVVAGVTLLFSIIIIVVIIIIRRGGSSGRRWRQPVPVATGDKPPQWNVVKMSVQEEGNKGGGDMEKVVAWRGSNVDIDLKGGVGDGTMAGGSDRSSYGQPDVTKTGNGGTLKKTAAGSQWHDDKNDSMQGPASSNIGIGLDPYRKQDFYTFCKVRNAPHDDVNSVTSGETATSDSGRGGSEDDIPLPPIAECSPELNSNHSSPKHVVEYRPITTSPPNSLGRQPYGSKSEFRTMPTLSSFRGGADAIKLYPVSSSTSRPQDSDTALSNSLGRSPYSSLPSSYGEKVQPLGKSGLDYKTIAPEVYTSGGVGGSPASKSIGSHGRHVTFSPNQPAVRGPGSSQLSPLPLLSDSNERSPFAPVALSDNGGYYSGSTSRPRSIDDDDGNTTTSGSYTIDSDNLNDSIISA